MLRLVVLLVFSGFVCDGQLIGGPFYPKAIGLGSGEFGGGGGHFGGGGGHYVGGVGHWYPGFGLGSDVGGAGFGGHKFGGAGLGRAGIGGGGIGGVGIGGHGVGIGASGAVGGEQVEHSVYQGGKKNLDNHHFVQSHGKKGEELHHGNGGFTKGEIAEKNVKGDSAYFSDVSGGKNAHHEGKDYHGGEHYSKGGHEGNQQTNKKGHKKGHRIKGFKTSHHLDEHGGTEEYYDEAHDEGGNYGFKGETAGFGEKGASSFKGGHEGGKYIAGEKKKSGHYGQEYISGKSEGNEGKFGDHKYSGHKGVIGEHKVVGSDDVSGYEDSSKFFKHY